MSSNRERRDRREQIMNSEKELPGDPERIKAEENEDYDAPDSGIFDMRRDFHKLGDPERRARINQSEEQLEGDFQRGDDDQFVDENGLNARNEPRSPSSQWREISEQELPDDQDRAEDEESEGYDPPDSGIFDMRRDFHKLGDPEPKTRPLENDEELAGDPLGAETHRRHADEQEDAP